MKVEKDIPIKKRPGGRGPSGGNRKRKYPFESMDVGDSFFVEGEDTQGKAAGAAKSHGRYHNLKFAARTVDGGVRIWRIV